MLDIGIFGPFGNDHNRNVAFCNDTNVRHIVLGVGTLTDDTESVPDADKLQRVADLYQERGIKLTGLTPPRVPQDAFVNDATKNQALDSLAHLFSIMGAADIPYAHFYLNVDPIDETTEDRSQLWQGLIGFYRDLSPIAAKAGVRVSTHHYHVPDRLLWNYDTMSTLLDAVDSPQHGVTFCQGKSQLAGDDLASDIRRYGNRIFMFHIRDVVTHVDAEIDPIVAKRLADMGYLEVPFGTGEVDMIGSFKALKHIGYKGQIYPEHYPSIAGDDATGLAWTIGYMRAMDAAVDS